MNNISRLQFKRLDVQQKIKIARDKHGFLTHRIIFVNLLGSVEQRAIGAGITQIDSAVFELQETMRSGDVSVICNG
jgi:hypothetical protein